MKGEKEKILGEEKAGKMILDSAFKVHTALGPGLLESVYEEALAIELVKRGLAVERQRPIPVSYDGKVIDVAFRADLVVENMVLVELKSVEVVTALFKKITNNYLRLANLRLGFLLNFNEVHLKDGIIRITNGLDGREFFNTSQNATTVDLKKPSPSSLTSSSSRETSFPSPSAQETRL